MKRIVKLLAVSLAAALLCGLAGCALTPRRAVSKRKALASLASQMKQAEGQTAFELGTDIAAVEDLMLVLPRGWSETEEGSGLFTPPDYPMDGSFLLVAVEPADDAALELGQEDLLNENRDYLQMLFGHEANFEARRYERETVGDYPALLFEGEYRSEVGAEYHLLEYLIFAENNYYVLYNGDADNAWGKAFEQSAGTLSVRQPAKADLPAPSDGGEAAPAPGEPAAPEEPAAADGSVTVNGVRLVLPDGWSAKDHTSLIYSPDFPADTSNINVQSTQKDPMFSLYTEEILKPAYEAMFENIYGREVPVNISAFAYTELNGLPALRVKMDYTLNGMEIEQLQYMIDGDSTYTVTYTQSGGAGWMDAFEESARTIVPAG